MNKIDKHIETMATVVAKHTGLLAQQIHQILEEIDHYCKNAPKSSMTINNIDKQVEAMATAVAKRTGLSILQIYQTLAAIDNYCNDTAKKNGKNELIN